MFTIQSNSIQTIKENIMTYFNSTLQEFTYLHEQVTEISNPDESYLGTLNLFFKEPVTSNDEHKSLQVLPVESLILTLFKALSKTLSKTSNQTTITKSQSQT